MREDFDLAALEPRIDGAVGPPPHGADDLEHELIAHAVGGLEGRGTIGIAHDLHQAFAIAQVDEDDAAMVAAAMRPPEQGDALAEKTGIGKSAVFGSHFFCGRSRGGRVIPA